MKRNPRRSRIIAVTRTQLLSLVLAGALLGNLGGWAVAFAEAGPTPAVRVCFRTKDGGSLYFPREGAGCRRGFIERSWGAAGPAGPAGPQGPQGPQGAAVQILGTLAATSELPEDGSTGDAYLIDGDLHVWSGDNMAWQNVGGIQGPQGDPGPQGDQGPQGPAVLPNAYVGNASATNITSSSWTTVLTLSGLPAGSYFVATSGEIRLTGQYGPTLRTTIDGDCKVTGGSIAGPSIQYFRNVNSGSTTSSAASSETIYQPIALSGVMVVPSDAGELYVQCLRRSGTISVQRIRLTAIPILSQ
jgi:hypothetical protein